MLCCSACYEEYSDRIVDAERENGERDCVCGPEEEFYGESVYTVCELCHKERACPSHLHCVKLIEYPLIKSANKS